jgi:hypothetical protein
LAGEGLFPLVGCRKNRPGNRGKYADWKHSGFSVDTSVRIEAGDYSGMQRLVEYISRCPFSLTRMVSITKDDKVLYRAGNAKCIPFPKTGDKDLTSGMPRNYEIYDPLDFLAEVTQHIPNKGEKAGCACASRNAGAGYSLSPEMPHDVGGAHQVRL